MEEIAHQRLASRGSARPSPATGPSRCGRAGIGPGVAASRWGAVGGAGGHRSRGCRRMAAQVTTRHPNGCGPSRIAPSVRQDRGHPAPRPTVGRVPTRKGCAVSELENRRLTPPETDAERHLARRLARPGAPGVGVPGRRDELGHRGQAGRRAHRDHRAARRGSPARRGRARRRQDPARQDPRPLDRLLGAPRAVHPRPAAERHHRRLGVQPGRARLRVPPGRDLRQRRRRGRDQPRLAQDPERAAGVDGGGPGHRRRHDLRARPGRSWSWPRRTRSRWRAPTRCPRPSATASWRASRWATRRPAPSSTCSTCTAGCPRSTACSRSPTPPRCRRWSRRCARCTPPPRCASTSSTSPTPPARARALRLGASPRATLHLLRASRAHAALAGRDHVLPDDVQQVAVPVLAHRLIPTGETQMARRTHRRRGRRPAAARPRAGPDPLSPTVHAAPTLPHHPRRGLRRLRPSCWSRPASSSDSTT